MSNKEITKPYLPGFKEFIIKKIKLRPNYYTQNDYFYHKEGKDFSVGYNPRCQLLDFTPLNQTRSYHQSFSKRDYLKFLAQTKRFWEDCCLEFFLLTGKHPNQYVVARLYGVQGLECEYITYLTDNEFGEWDEVDNWQEQARRYQKNQYFKQAYYGPQFEQPTRFKKLKYRGKKYKKQYLLPEVPEDLVVI